MLCILAFKSLNRFEVYIQTPSLLPKSKSRDTSVASTCAASATDPPMTPSAVATSSMTEGERLQDVEEEVFLLKKDIARMKEDTEENIVLLKRDNARMRVELE